MAYGGSDLATDDLVDSIYRENTVNLPPISDKKLLERYRGRIERTKKWREDEGYDATWKRLRDAYRGKMYESFSDEDRAAVNLMFATINVILPSIAVNNPKITVNARKEDESDQATIAEAMVNYYWSLYNYQPELKTAVKDYLVIGHGWLKVGWRLKEEEVPLDPEEIERHMAEALEVTDAFGEEAPELVDDLPSENDLYDAIPKKTTKVVKDCPFVERVSPNDILVDPEATSLREATWVAQRIIRPIDEAKKDKRYAAGARRKLTPDREVKDQRVKQDSDHLERYKDDLQRVTLWEFYDLKRNTVSVFSAHGDEKYLVAPKKMPYEFGLPFVMLRNYDVPDSFYPMGDLEALEPIQTELNATRTQLMNHRKSAQRKYLYDQSKFDQQGIDGLTSDIDNTLVPVKGGDLQSAIAPMPHHGITAELYSYSETITGDIDRVSGISEYARGALPEIRRTATEASIIQDAANARAADKLDTIEKAIQEVGRKLVQLAQQYVTAPQAIRVAGPQGQIWGEFHPEDIQGEFDFSVEAGSTQPMNETFRRQQAMQMMNALAPFVGPPESGAPLNAHELLRVILRDGFGYKNPERMFNPALPPMPPEGMEGEPPLEAEGEEVPPDQVGPGPEAELMALMQQQEGPRQMPALGEGMLQQFRGQMGAEFPHLQPG